MLYDDNGGSLVNPHGDKYTLDGNRILKDNSDLIHSIDYGASIGSDGLINWNNTSVLNLSKSGYIAKSGAEWIIDGGNSKNEANLTTNNDCGDRRCCQQKFYASSYLQTWSYESWGHEGWYYLKAVDKAGNSYDHSSYVPYENRNC